MRLTVDASARRSERLLCQFCESSKRFQEKKRFPIALGVVSEVVSQNRVINKAVTRRRFAGRLFGRPKKSRAREHTYSSLRVQEERSSGCRGAEREPHVGREQFRCTHTSGAQKRCGRRDRDLERTTTAQCSRVRREYNAEMRFVKVFSVAENAAIILGRARDPRGSKALTGN